MRQITPELILDLLHVGGFKTAQALSILARADFRCEYCSQDLLASLTECFNAQLDHIVPKSKGGPNEEPNFAACCTTCNSLKWDYVPVGETRAERIADAARYISDQRSVQEGFLLKYRQLMGREVSTNSEQRITRIPTATALP